MAGRKKMWSRDVGERSNALDLPANLFTRSARGIASGLKQAAQRRSGARSKARSDYQAAMSMLNFYINRAGRNLSSQDRARLESAKDELRHLFARN